MRVKPDLVITAVGGYQWEQIRPYVISLTRTGFQGDKVILASKMDVFALECATNRGFKVIPFSVPADTNSWTFTSKQRYIPLIQFLAKHRQKYRNVLWVDASDLIFQTNPSDWFDRHDRASTIYAARECWRIKDETQFNDPWVKAAFPNDYDWLRNEEVLCGGTLAGSADAVFEALVKIFKITSEHPEYADQAVLNYVLHKPFNFPPGTIQIPAMKDGFAATCSAFRTDDPIPTELCKLALKYRTDKVAQFRHHYTPYYHELLKDRRDFKKVLEIGIGYPNLALGHVPNYRAGASLRMWQDYFPEAEIYGLDIEPSALVNEGRIKSFICDQSDSDSLQHAVGQVGGNFDLIIDDGSHNLEHQVFTAKRLLPLLNSTGIYVIEDVLDAKYIVNHLSVPCEVQTFDTSLGDDTLIIIQNSKCPKPRNRFNSVCPKEELISLTDEMPVFDQEQGLVLTPDGKTPFMLVHQWNRDKDWVQIIPNKYKWD